MTTLPVSASGDLLLRFAWQASLVLAALIALLVFQILASGFWLNRRRRRHDRFRDRWEPILAASAFEPQDPLPALAPRDLIPFLQLWNYFQGIVLAEASLNLDAVARRTGADAGARRRLHSSGAPAPTSGPSSWPPSSPPSRIGRRPASSRASRSASRKP